MKRKSTHSRKSNNPFRKNRKPTSVRQKQKGNGFEYQVLEQRQLLATNLGMNLTGHTYQTQSFDKDPNMVGDIGTTHYIETIGDKISAFNRVTGTRDIYKTQTQFWIDSGATVSSPSINNATPLFDRFANRWLIVGEGSEVSGNYLYIAISNTANPLDGFKASRFVGDSTGIRHNGDVAVALDSDALLITTRNTTDTVGFPISVSIFSIPRADLYLVFPTLTNMTRHENLNRATYGDYLRPAMSLEASDGKATFIGHSIDGAQTIRTDLFNVHAFGATLGPGRIIDFDPSSAFTYFRNFSEGVPVPDHRQTEVNNIDQFLRTKGPTGVPVSSMINNVIDINGGLWYAQTINADIYLLTGTDFSGIVVQEINKERNELDHANLVIMPETVMFPNTEEWDLYNPSLSVNKYGVMTLNYTVSSADNSVNPSAASSIGITVNGISTYDPIFDVINVPPKPWVPPNPLPYRFDRPGRNTQFELVHNFPDDDRPEPEPDDDPNADRDDFIQEGLDPYLNADFALNISSWSHRASGMVDPLNENRFWVDTQWANVLSRWSTQITQIIPQNMRPVLTADYADNVIVVRRNAADTNLLEIEMDGVVTDILPYEVLGNVVINGYEGADRFILDYSNGDPVPSGGFTFNGMGGSDTVETNDPNGGRFVVDGRPIDRGPTWLAYSTSTGDGSGTYNEKTFFVNVEELIGGPGPDHFLVTDYIDPLSGFTYFGYLPGSLTGNAGDDLFEFARVGGRIGDSVYGNEGYNTLSFKDRFVDTKATLLGYGGISGYEGRANSPDGPIGDSQIFDRFSNINYIRGSDTFFDTIVGLDFVTNVFVDDENSTYETNGVVLGFFEVNAIDCSSFDDLFIGIRNSVNPLQLNGHDGNDVYHFSSDAPTDMGSTEPLGNLLFAQGGSGINELYVSNRGGPAVGGGPVPALILNNRISGIGEIAYNSNGGIFNLHVWASEFADRIDLHSFLPGNTLELYLLGGNDVIDIQDLSKAFVDVYGGAGDDLYIIQKVQGVDFRNLVLHDSIGSERDRVTLAGTILNEIFFITNTTFVDTNVVYSGIETFGVEGRGGDDIFNVIEADFELFIDGQEGNDIFNFSSDAPTNLGNVNGVTGLVSIEGGLGLNQLRISNFSGSAKSVTMSNNTISGLLSQPLTYLSTGGQFALSSGIGGITITSSDTGSDIYNVTGLNVDDTLKILGLGGNELFTVGAGALGHIILDGGAGLDTHTVSLVGTGSREVTVIDGPANTTRLDVIGTSASDLITVSLAAVTRGTEMVKVQAALALMNVFGQNGNDEITVTGATATTLNVFGEVHDDKLTVASTSGITNLLVDGGMGNDTLTFQSVLLSTAPVGMGGDGNDTYHVGVNALPDIRLNGQEGGDRINVTYLAAGDREVDARDTGVLGQDVLNVMSSAGDDLLALNVGMVTKELQNVLYDNKTDRLVVNAQAGNDTVDVFGTNSPSVLILGNDGEDKVSVLSNTSAVQIAVDGGMGNDIFVVKDTLAGTKTTLYGKDGDDRFNVGSTLEENLGNLSTIRGIVAAIGGPTDPNGQDRLYVNDIIGGQAYAYNLTAKFIKPLAGPNNLPRAEFAGITFDKTMEHVRLDGTLLPNFFSIEASPDTEFYLNGNLPSPGTPNGDMVYLRSKPNDGHFIKFTDPARGRGYISFTNGDEIIRFDNIESTFATSPTNMPPSDGDDEGPWNMMPPGSGSPPSLFMMAYDDLAGSIDLDDEVSPDDSLTSGLQNGNANEASVDELDQIFADLM